MALPDVWIKQRETQKRKYIAIWSTTKKKQKKKNI